MVFRGRGWENGAESVAATLSLQPHLRPQLQPRLRLRLRLKPRLRQRPRQRPRSRQRHLLRPLSQDSSTETFPAAVPSPGIVITVFMAKSNISALHAPHHQLSNQDQRALAHHQRRTSRQQASRASNLAYIACVAAARGTVASIHWWQATTRQPPGRETAPASSSSLFSSPSQQVRVAAGSGDGQDVIHGGMESTSPCNPGVPKPTSVRLSTQGTDDTVSSTVSSNIAPCAPTLDVTKARRAPSPAPSLSSSGTINRASKTTDTISQGLAYTAIRDPSLGDHFQSQGLNSLETAPASSSSPAASRGNLLPTSIIITITLAIVAGLAVLAVALFCLYFRRKRRRSGPLGSAGRWDDDTKSKKAHKAPLAVSARPPLSPLSPVSPLSPSFPPPPAPTPFPAARPPARPPAPPSEASPSFGMGASAGMSKSKSLNASSGNGTLSPPPRLNERKFHNSTKSDSSIQLVKRYTHTRWGKPSSLPILSPSSSTTQPVEAQPASYQPVAGAADDRFRNARGHMPARQAGSSHLGPNHLPKRPSPITVVPPPRHLRSGATTPSAFSIHASANDRNGSLTSIPRTPRQVDIPVQVMGLESPGPPPDRALPSPPLQPWQVNPLSPPAEAQMGSLRPEEIGLAIGSPFHPDANTGEKRPPLV
ncbi:hypothetical protein E4U54_004694 [Claviceps lovelessii]|nr:hypothetical protein E4U54_004694 [Claviceps lovelessii]